MPKKRNKADELADILHHAEVQGLKGQLADLNEKYKQTIYLLREADHRLNAVLGFKDAMAGYPAKPIVVKAHRAAGESTAVLVGSDWHLEERVDPKAVNGLNEYDLEISSARIVKFFQNGLAMLEMTRGKSKIDTLILALLGDLITGYIHDELVESNLLSPTEAILKAYTLIQGGIDFLLDEGKLERLIVPCCVGNHARTTTKRRISTLVQNSYEWLLYQFLAMLYRDDPRVEFRVADGYFVFADVYGTKLRFHHGDDVKYQGGVGGLTIPLNKAIAQWNKASRADIDVLGHWHTRINQRDCVVNGSAIGYSALSIALKTSYELPAQSFFLIHPKWGKTVEIPIFLN